MTTGVSERRLSGEVGGTLGSFTLPPLPSQVSPPRMRSEEHPCWARRRGQEQEESGTPDREHLFPEGAWMSKYATHGIQLPESPFVTGSCGAEGTSVAMRQKHYLEAAARKLQESCPGQARYLL